MQRKQTYSFPEIEDYREQLEIKHLRSKNHIILGIIFFFMLITMAYMIFGGFELVYILSLLVGFLGVIFFNIASLAYGNEDSSFYNLNKFITSLGVFGLATAMIFIFKSPSFISGLFIAYAIAAFYQDLKVILISDLYLFFTILMIMWNYPEYLSFDNAQVETDFGTFFFIILFVLLLTISSYIIIKQKRFLYNQLALSKESEFRNIDLLISAEKEAIKRKIEISKYYRAVESFTQAFSEKLKIDNIFSEKLKIMLAMEKGTPVSTLLSKYPHYTSADLIHIEDLLISANHKLRKTIIKISKMRDLVIKKREIFSETQLKSFNQPSDSLEIKIIAFSVFYVSLRLGSELLKPLSSQEIYNILIYTDYYYYNDPQIMHIYQENHEVFDTIVNDYIGRNL
jgi:flagellin-specific chaperone FliS